MCLYLYPSQKSTHIHGHTLEDVGKKLLLAEAERNKTKKKNCKEKNEWGISELTVNPIHRPWHWMILRL